MTDQIEPQATVRVDADETGQRRIMIEGANAYRFSSNPLPMNPYTREQEAFWWEVGYNAARREAMAAHEQNAETLRQEIEADQARLAEREAQLHEIEDGPEPADPAPVSSSEGAPSVEPAAEPSEAPSQAPTE